MCGIAGCVVEEGREPPRAELGAMLASLEHRGPDDSGIEICGPVGLAHTRLSIQDPSASGHQPMLDRSGRWVLSYNGEIYNHAELRRSLDEPFRGHSDTETLVQALDAWGPHATVKRLNGIFAFAAYDTASRRLYLVRDHVGIKPLYYARTNESVWFASEIKALLAAGVPRRVRREPLARALIRSWAVGTTHLEGIEPVAPGTIVEVDVGSRTVRETRWYDLIDVVDPDLAAELQSSDENGLTDRLEETLRRSVHGQLLSDAPLGVMNSGGLDSTVIAALAAERMPQLKTFNATVQARRDELPWAKRAARAIDVDLVPVAITPSTWRNRFVATVNDYEYPLPNSGPEVVGAVANRAHADGMKVLLTGEGSDEIFGGYGLTFWWRDAWKVVPISKRPQWAIDQWRSATSVTVGTVLRRRFRPRPAHLLERAGVRARTAADEDFWHRARSAYSHHDGVTAAVEAHLLRQLTFASLPQLLNRQDKNPMRSSVECRVPYLDPDVIALVVNLPLAMRIGPRAKLLLRRVAQRLLPRRIARRRKQPGVRINSNRYFRGADRAFLDDGCLRDIYEVPREVWRAGVRSLDGGQITRMWSGEVWCRLFLEGQSIEAVEEELWKHRS